MSTHPSVSAGPLGKLAVWNGAHPEGGFLPGGEPDGELALVEAAHRPPARTADGKHPSSRDLPGRAGSERARELGESEAPAAAAEAAGNIQSEDHTAALELWSAHYAALAGWCAALVGDRETAHDIASEAFTRLFAKWRKVRDPRGYLYVTATNLARDRWRREQRSRRLHLRLQTETPSCVEAPSPWLRDLVRRLPARMRTPVLLHYYADMPIAQVAMVLHRPQGTIKRT
jgi:RNA polymerase sigma-70 factor (ECF subfamily)